MNKRQKEKKEKKYIKDKLIVDVTGKNRIKIVFESKEKNLMENQLQLLKKEYDEIEENIKKTYYSNNTVVDRVENRDFFDLLRLLKKPHC